MPSWQNLILWESVCTKAFPVGIFLATTSDIAWIKGPPDWFNQTPIAGQSLSGQEVPNWVCRTVLSLRVTALSHKQPSFTLWSSHRERRVKQTQREAWRWEVMAAIPSDSLGTGPWAPGPLPIGISLRIKPWFWSKTKLRLVLFLGNLLALIFQSLRGGLQSG